MGKKHPVEDEILLKLKLYKEFVVILRFNR